MISKTPALGSKRKHYKGYPDGDHIYEVVGIGKHSETEEFLVVYKEPWGISNIKRSFMITTGKTSRSLGINILGKLVVCG